ncbi:3'(2'),5'-bisphosphate nucleotidase CysQ [Paracoccaceae bacterium]|nr:3'(2'),5'-bisphosphate nucleotidase CysQ [Paracoccaceae bacterium]
MIDNLIHLAIDAGMMIRKIYESGDFKTYIKSDCSPVTTADKKADEIILKGLKSLFPRIPVVSEESEGEKSPSELFFLVDPLDGTKGFLNKTGNFTVNIALIENAEPKIGVIFSPMTGEVFHTTKEKESFKYNFLRSSEKEKLNCDNNRRLKTTIITSENYLSKKETNILKSGTEFDNVRIGSSIKFCKIAEGMADIYPRFGRTMEWDTAAGHAILNFAGGSLIDLRTRKDLKYGKKGFENGDFLALRKSYDFDKINRERIKWVT